MTPRNPTLASADPLGLQRFVDAQAPVWEAVQKELANGRKESHWMWFVFPQLSALGHSGTARFYGLSNSRHARSYWAHPILGPRLLRCTQQVLDLRGRSAHHIFGSPDDLKLCSCMTLFESVVVEEQAFGEVLDHFYGGARDILTQSFIREDG